ncbi:MAG TPA: PepSY domain-containing protein [Rhodanobacter sp.]|nr:PepSY domain-containing protein [Rhodanobacter sp.]
MSLNHRFLKTTRTLHLYLGVFTAPMLLFFAISGGLQTFGLHEAGRGSSYSPPAWLASMAQLHKKQTVVVPTRRARAPQPAGAAIMSSASPVPATVAPVTARVRESGRVGRNLLPMKIFFALVALSLFTSVLSGLYMAWRFSRRPRLFAGLLLGGVVVPLLLLLV